MPEIKNTTTPKGKVESIPLGDVHTHLFKNHKMIVDFSFEGTFVSCDTGDFNNFLNDEGEFVQKFRLIMQDVQNLSQETLRELIQSKGYRHCHLSDDESKALKIISSICRNIGKDDSYMEQVIEGEEIFQIGLHSEIRLFGTINGNVFRVYFVDYHHDFEYDQKRNKTNTRYCHFCAMQS
jgi:hypothetical protein